MKKIEWILLLMTAVILTGCTSVRDDLHEYLNVVLIRYSAGSGVEGADITVFDAAASVVLGHAVTDGQGKARVPLSGKPEYVNLVFTKHGYAVSAIEGLDLNKADDSVIEAVIRKADLNLDPLTQTEFPEYELNFFYPPEFWEDDPIPVDIEKPVTRSFNVELNISKSKNHIYAVLPPILGRIPADSQISPDFGWQLENKKSGEFEVPILGYYGTTELNLVMYDYNGNRLHRIVYLDIQPEAAETLPEKVYRPIPAAALGYVNVMAYTRRLGKDFLTSPRTADENSNLVAGVFCVDYATALNKGLIDADVVRPDGYAVYRSFGDDMWERIGFVSSQKADQRLSWTDNAIMLQHPGLFFKSSAFVVDCSAQLETGKEVFYSVSAVYGKNETERTFLGSVIPLESYGIVMDNPSNGQAKAWRQPEFVFGPDKDMSSEMGNIRYFYRVFIYDCVQDINRWILPVNTSDASVPNLGTLFEKTDGERLSVYFTGNLPRDGIVWYSYFDGQVEKLWQPYSWDMLEAHKAYSWGVNLAYAMVVSEERNSMAVSVAADSHPYLGSSGVDIVSAGMPPDWMYEFTTGTN